MFFFFLAFSRSTNSTSFIGVSSPPKESSPPPWSKERRCSTPAELGSPFCPSFKCTNTSIAKLGMGSRMQRRRIPPLLRRVLTLLNWMFILSSKFLCLDPTELSNIFDWILLNYLIAFDWILLNYPIAFGWILLNLLISFGWILLNYGLFIICIQISYCLVPHDS